MGGVGKANVTEGPVRKRKQALRRVGGWGEGGRGRPLSLRWGRGLEVKMIGSVLAELKSLQETKCGIKKLMNTLHWMLWGKASPRATDLGDISLWGQEG